MIEEAALPTTDPRLRQVAAGLVEQRVEQGLPPHIKDISALTQIADAIAASDQFTQRKAVGKLNSPTAPTRQPTPLGPVKTRRRGRDAA